MIVTPLKVIHLPEVYAQKARYEKMEVGMKSYLSSIDYVDRLRGEVVSPGQYDVFNLRIEQENLSEMDMRTVRIKCKDGDVFAYRRFLLRHFHFFDDYFDQFPEETSISVPFSQEEVEYVLSNTGESLLKTCYDCLSFMNPKDPLHYFIFDTNGLNDDILYRIVNNLPSNARKDLLEARRMRYTGGIPPPLEGTGMGVASHVLEYYDDFDHLLSFFSECPSYLVWSVPSCRNDLLRTADFSKESANLIHREADSIRVFIRYAILDSNEKEHIRRLLAMVGIKSELIDNKNYYILAPYHAKLVTHVISPLLVNKLAEVFLTSPDTISNLLG